MTPSRGGHSWLKIEGVTITPSGGPDHSAARAAILAGCLGRRNGLTRERPFLGQMAEPKLAEA